MERVWAKTRDVRSVGAKGAGEGEPNPSTDLDRDGLGPVLMMQMRLSATGRESARKCLRQLARCKLCLAVSR